MKKGLLALIALVAFVFALPTISEAKIEITGAALVSAQDVDFDTTSGNLDEDFNFNDPRINLNIAGEVTDKISVTAKLWINNDWSAENQRSGQNQLGGGGVVAGNMGSLNDAVELIRAYVTLKDVMGSGFDVKVGTIDIPFGWEYAVRTANGDNSKNDFISNSLLDINGGDEGIALSGSFDMGQTSTPLAWEIALLNGGGVTDGNPSGAVGAGNNGRSNDDLSWAVRAEVGVYENVTLQASYYTADNRKDGTQDPLNIGSAFMVQNLNLNNANVNLAGLVTTVDPTGSNSGGFDRDIWEVSAKYDYGQGYLLAFWGNIDSDSGSAASVAGGNREWDYWGVQGRYNFDENSYFAARWNTLEPDYNIGGQTMSLGEPELLTIAAGYKLADNAVVKAEWSSFDEDGNGMSNSVAPSTDNKKADADALTVALGVSF